MGHPIANDPIYQNRAAWGDDGGKGGVFGSVRGGTTADREERRRRGEQFMALEQAKIVEPAHAGDSAAPPISEPASAEPSAVEQQLDRKLHDPTLTDGARRAILALREVKDEADGWARHRDLEGIERARQSGPSKLSVDATAAALAEAQIDGKSSAESADATINDGGFCSICFTPLMPDPRPEQLFIWLHAMRCAFNLADLYFCVHSPPLTSILPFVMQTRRPSGIGQASYRTGQRRNTRYRSRLSSRRRCRSVAPEMQLHPSHRSHHDRLSSSDM